MLTSLVWWIVYQIVMKVWYCSKATSQTNATFCDLRARIECNECVLSMRTSLDFRILYAKMNVAKESSAKIPILRHYKGLSSVHFVSRVACEFQRDTSKDNRSFATLPLSSTVVSKYVILLCIDTNAYEGTYICSCVHLFI